ncbi:hypothetical protein BKA83DRAFT_4132466 [Pisolithus microcarpus]|nr:hypothetical protein BKA83DRAFT_4132459 [Pisolithus microcarpus]KAI6010629.1 hypothetical protein BKA83DRAFT_4132466 [Pisolithus microcarpus]
MEQRESALTAGEPSDGLEGREAHKGHRGSTEIESQDHCSGRGVQQVLEQPGKSSDSIPDDVQNWFRHFEALGGCKGLVSYQHVLSAMEGLPISLPRFHQVWNSVDTEGHGWLDLGGFARFRLLVQSNWQFLVGNMEGTRFLRPSNVHADSVRYSQGQPLALMNHQAHQLQLNDSLPRQDPVTTVPSGFSHLQVDPMTTTVASTNLARTPLGPVGTTVDTWMGQNPRTSQTTGLAQFREAPSFQLQGLHQREQNVVDYRQLNHGAPGDIAAPFCDKPWGEPVVPPVALSQHPVSVGRGTGIPQRSTANYAPHVPMFLAFGPQQAASTSQGTQPNQCFIPPVPRFQPTVPATQGILNPPAASARVTNQPQEADTGKEKQTMNNEQKIPMADSGTGAIFSLMSTRMSELIAAVNASSEAHKDDMKQLRMEFNGLMELNHQVLKSRMDSGGTQASSQARNEPSASRPTRRRKQPRLEDRYHGQPGHTKFRQSIQKHFLRLLHITDYSCLDQSPPPPSDEENLAFNRRDPGCLKITPDNFHIDLSRSCQMPFNTEAIRVFAKDFKTKVDESKWYSFPAPLPAHFLQLEYIELSLFLHLHHVKDVYTNSKKSHESCHARLKSAACSMRKTRLVGSQGVSSDESDTGLEGHKVYRKISPAWRSPELADFMHSIDSLIISNRHPRVGHRSIRGQEPRWRIPSNLVNEDAVAPPKLPLNCYKDSWLACLWPSERKKLNAQANKWYNFESRRMENIIPPPGGATFSEMQVDGGNSSDTSTELEKGDDTRGVDSMDEDFTVQLMTSDEDFCCFYTIHTVRCKSDLLTNPVLIMAFAPIFSSPNCLPAILAIVIFVYLSSAN